MMKRSGSELPCQKPEKRTNSASESEDTLIVDQDFEDSIDTFDNLESTKIETANENRVVMASDTLATTNDIEEKVSSCLRKIFLATNIK